MLDGATFPRGRRWIPPVLGRRQGTKDLTELRRRLDTAQASEVTHCSELYFSVSGELTFIYFLRWSGAPGHTFLRG